MPTQNQLGHKVVFLAALALLSVHAPVEAQLLSKWGHPVITFSWSPYDWDETGLGHYYGRPWPPPPSGSYPGHAPGQSSPWTQGHDMPVDLSKITPPADETPPPGAALVIVKLPAEAELWFDETKTSQDGSYRRFVTPPLQRGHRHIYTLRVHWHIQDADLTRVEKVEVESGKRITVNFLTVDSWTGVRAETLPQPRKLP
jgi:uncharacterized protein (TIGR03000 family)